MKCDEVAEFVSALCDGEIIPRAAAEHIGACVRCQALMREYAAMGAELRRVASLEPEHDVNPLTWEKRQGNLSTLWQKGWGMMRIPRFAFAVLVGAVLVLGSSLAMVKVGAHSEGSVLLLTVTRASGGTFQCALDQKEIPKARCAEIGKEKNNMVGYELALLAKDGNRAQLGVRTAVGPAGPFSTNDMGNTPQTTYSFEPGETLKLNIAGVGAAQVTGEWTDHVPAVLGEHHDLDPEPNELRVISPLLLKGKQVVGDMEGGSSYSQSDSATEIYFPGSGKFLLSLSPMKGAVQSKVAFNRISFQWNGQEYVFLTGAPVARSDQQVWVLYEPNYKADDSEHGFIGGGKLKDVAPEAVIPDTSAKN
jgi:hypothetical protein